MMPNFEIAIAYVKRVIYFKPDIKSKQKLHMTLGHHTVMGVSQYFSTTFEESKIDMDNEDELVDHFQNDVLPRICDFEEFLPRQGPKAPEEI